jgi:hypothetical protein
VPIRTSVIAVICALLVAACGGSSAHSPKGKVGPYGPRSSPYAMSKCMRANGLTNFPDPSQGPDGGGVGFPGGVVVSVEGELTVDGITFSGPALKRASAACKIYLPGGGGPPPSMSAAEKKAALEFAQCMRAHGVPNFPDPGTGGPLGSGQSAKQSLPDANSPAFKHAGQACGHGGRFEIRGANVEGP